VKLGFTGTQVGMTAQQRETFRATLTNLDFFDEFHHGCCVGADAEAHRIMRELRPDVKIVGHPPIVQGAKFAGVIARDCDELREPLDFMVRNQAIVDETDLLVAIPRQASEQLRSGTWATVRRAGVRTIIIQPNGVIK
jgi:hypothetical protein